MKHLYLLTLLVVFATSFSVTAQQQYTNGNLATGTINNAGVTAPAGYVWSELQHDPSDPTITNVQTGIPVGTIYFTYKLADDFVVPEGEVWQIDNFEFFIFDEGEGTNEMQITDLRIEIWNGSPALTTSSAIFGDLTTNTLDLANSGEAFIYQSKNSSFPEILPLFPDGGVKIFKIRGNVTGTLPSGTYYVVFQIVHPTSNGVKIPLNKYNDTRGYPQGNPAQYFNTSPGGIWRVARDPGAPNPAPDIDQDYPFHINYNQLLSTPDLGTRTFNLHPNPAKDNITVKSTHGGWASPVFEIIDLKGAQVYSLENSDVVTDGESFTIDISQLAKGLYVLKIVEDGEVYSWKFIKE